ncbi:unnamed protein product (macronuclear) [Paramecium tetraurelia]|uniref:Uncharacterized protein n=1 Tax=Paramecium tetraurelia TaxID=5888 RepID=A0BKN1_PARTE|nr:uncharacterized protein GSPATT00029729001 [Paramecium tetraurelia]CAK59098.1 unnamed protein product [Paramecium tetraurelia]|eukprot:XP_001426496.1 hypothetical protein (macronuclear) [Paramecium tetraurelia strain d4-2]
MHINKLSEHQNQKSGSFVHLSPQAYEALQTLEQIKKNNILQQNSQIVRRVSSQYVQQPSQKNQQRTSSQLQASPIQQRKELQTNSSLSFIRGALQSNRTNKMETEGSHKPNSQTERQISQQQTLGKSDEPTPFFRDTLSSDRNKCNQTSLSQYLSRHQFQQQFKYINEELQAFKQQVENDVLIETTIPKIVSSLQTNLKRRIFLLQTKLMMKKQLILNQILSLDNQIKIMEDEETKIALDPQKSKKKQNTTHSPSKQQIVESLYERAQKKQSNFQKLFEETQISKEQNVFKECTFIPKINKQNISGNFMERLDDWIKRKNKKITQQQEQSQERIMRECTFSPLHKQLNKTNLSHTAVYQRNQEWQNRINIKKQKMKAQNSFIQMSAKKEQSTPKKIHKRSSSQQYQIDLAKILQSTNSQNTTKRVKQQSPILTEIQSGILNASNKKIENVDTKYQQLCEMANRIKAKSKN